MKIDVTKELSGGSFGPIAEGAHIVAVSAADFGLSKSGNDMVTIKFRVIGPDDKDNGRELRAWYVLNPSQVKRYVSLARAIDPKMRPHDASDQNDLNELVWGKPLVISVEHEEDEYKGQPVVRERVTKHTSLTDREVTALAEAYGSGLVPELPDAIAF